jgi:esterase/lipase
MLEQIKVDTKTLIQSYEQDFEDFLNIEIDVDIEEARKLHRINHYTTFLESLSYSSNANEREYIDPLIEELNNLKQRSKQWVYQDTINAKKLERYAVKSLEYGTKVLESSEALEDEQFPGIQVRSLHLIDQRIPGLLIFKENNINNLGRFIPNRGIILIHGIFYAKEGLAVLGKRLASLDYIVYSIDMSSHGESLNQFRLGIICEHILKAVSWLRSQGVRNVGVVGHSLGSVCTLFALGGYNRNVENRFYDTTTKLIEEIKNIKKPLDKIAKNHNGSDDRAYEDQYNKAVYHSTLLIKEYKELKQIILDGLSEMYQSNSRIDAVVLLSAPKTCQMFFPPQIARIIKHLPKVLSRPGTRLLSRVLTKGYIYKYKKQEGQSALVPSYSNKKGMARFIGGNIEDVYASFDYAEKVKNPYDFMKNISYFCDNVKNPDKVTNFIKYYRDFIRKTPKLYIYGLADKQVIKGFYRQFMSITEANKLELQKHYENFGATDIARVPDVDHFLNTDIRFITFQSARLPRIANKIVTFLNNYLGRGR